MNRRNVTIVVIAVLAFGVALVIYGILSQPRKVASPPRNVVIAAMNIPANSRIVPAMVTTEQKPTDQVDPTALADPADAVGMLAVSDVPQGAQITPARLARPAAAPQGLQVAVGLRAITIAVDQVKGIAGLLQPGDHVDVLATPNRVYNDPKAYAIVRDARVLAINQNLGIPQPAPTGSASPGPAPTPPVNFTVTLAVSPPQADTIMAADLNGTVRLALRSSHEPARSMAAEAFIYPTPVPAQTPNAFATPPGMVQVVNGDASAQVRP